LRAIILIALVGHATADIKCYDTTTSAVDAACAADSCWTLVPTDTGKATQRGCGLEAVCTNANTGENAGTCRVCTTDETGGCNAVENERKCYVGTVTDGVVAGAVEFCTPLEASCHSRSLKVPGTTVTVEKGCGACPTDTDDKYDCTPVDAKTTCTKDSGCNVPIISCFTSTGALTRYTTEICPEAAMLTCFTRTKDDDKTVEFGCGKCDTSATGYTCGDDCGTIVAAGCNEPPRFQCLQKDNWNVTDTTTKATDCVTGDGAAKDSSLYTQTSCSKIVKDDGTINKACGACPSPAVDGQTCYQCDETGCNSASGLFSVLALSMAVIYQLA